MYLFSILNLFLMIKGKEITFDVIIIFCINIFIFNPISQQAGDETHPPGPAPSR